MSCRCNADRLPCSRAESLSDLLHNFSHCRVLLQAEGDSWPSSHAATPRAVVLAAPSPGLPGAPSRQESGMAEELDHSWSGVSSEVEGTTRQVGWPTNSSTSMMLPAKHLTVAGRLILCSGSPPVLGLLACRDPLLAVLQCQIMPC